MSGQGEDAAAQAFQSLEAEVAAIGRKVDEMRAGLGKRAVDYSPTLGAMQTALEGVEANLSGLQRHPALAMTPEAFGARVEQAVERTSRQVAQGREGAARMMAAGREMQALVGSAQERRDQDRRLIQVGAIGIVAGLILFPFVIIAPVGWLGGWDWLGLRALGASSRWEAGLGLLERAGVSATVRWEAGLEMMRRARPADYERIVELWHLGQAGGAELKGCFEALQKAGKEQRCTLTLKPTVPTAR